MDAELLCCWKEIAQYMGKGVRTVQRWERELGLPVLRPIGADHKSAVVAHPHDLDAWLESRWSARSGEKQHAAFPVIDRTALREMRIEIHRASVLREEHGSLVGEIRSALETLIQSCDRLSRPDRSAN